MESFQFMNDRRGNLSIKFVIFCYLFDNFYQVCYSSRKEMRMIDKFNTTMK